MGNNHMSESNGARSAHKSHPLLPRSILLIIRFSGLLPSAIAFVLLFFCVSLIVCLTEPGIGGFGNAAWLMFEAVTTIGFGDYTCVTFAGRMATVVLSLYSIFFLALITGAVVTACSERLQEQRNGSIAQFLDRLERLPELSKEELTELSEQVKRFNRS